VNSAKDDSNAAPNTPSTSRIKGIEMTHASTTNLEISANNSNNENFSAETSEIAAAAMAANNNGIGDYVEDEFHQRKETLLLNQQFETIKLDVDRVVQQHRQGKRFFITNLVETVIFWKKGSSVKNYLPNLLGNKILTATGKPKKFKMVVNHGHNFAPLLNQLWANHSECELVAKKTNRLSRAMNTIDKMITDQGPVVDTTTEKIVDQIVKNGGLSGLVSYGSKVNSSTNENMIADSAADQQLCKKDMALSNEEKRKLFAQGLEHFNNVTVLPTANFNAHIAVNDENMSLVLVRQNPTGDFSVIGDVQDKSQIESVVAAKYSGDISSISPSMRVVMEILMTQCLPNRLQETYKKLLEVAGKFGDGSKSHVVRRLFYKHAAKTFVLSPIRAESGVITIAKPLAEVFEDQSLIEEDLQLSTMSRRNLEREIISARKFKSYLVEDEQGIGLIPCGNSFSHGQNMIGIEKEKSNSQKRFQVIFDPENTDTESIRQACVDIEDFDAKTPLWSRTVSADWIKTFNAAFTSKWMDNHAKYMARNNQKNIELEFSRKSLQLGFFSDGKEYDCKVQVEVPVSMESRSVSAYVLSKDFAIAMHGLDDLKITKDVQLRLYKSLLRITYWTDVAAYELLIPTCNSSGVRHTDGFYEYRLESLNLDPQDDLSFQTEEEMCKE